MKIKTFIIILTIITAINCAIAPSLPYFFNKTMISGPNSGSGPKSITDFLNKGQKIETEPSNPPIFLPKDPLLSYPKPPVNISPSDLIQQYFPQK